MYKCEKCNLEFETFQAKANHHRWHHLGYMYKSLESKIKTEEHLYGKIIEEDVICNNEKCNNLIHIKYREGKKKEKYFCSRGCANTRKFTQEQKNKIKNALTKETEYKWKEPHKKICKVCNKEFETTSKKQEVCSRNCSRKHNIEKAINFNRGNKKVALNISNGRKEAFKNGLINITGGTTKWFKYKDIKVQGTYELRACFIFDKWKEEGKIKNWEYTNDRIEYIDLDSKKHTYLLDFKIFENDNSFYYIETKGYKKDNDELKWKAVRDKGYKLEVWFEENILKEESSLTYCFFE